MILFLRHDINCLDEFLFPFIIIQPYSQSVAPSLFNLCVCEDKPRISCVVPSFFTSLLLLFHFFYIFNRKIFTSNVLGKVVKTFYYTIYYGPAVRNSKKKKNKNDINFACGIMRWYDVAFCPTMAAPAAAATAGWPLGPWQLGWAGLAGPG